VAKTLHIFRLLADLTHRESEHLSPQSQNARNPGYRNSLNHSILKGIVSLSQRGDLSSITVSSKARTHQSTYSHLIQLATLRFPRAEMPRRILIGGCVYFVSSECQPGSNAVSVLPSLLAEEAVPVTGDLRMRLCDPLCGASSQRSCGQMGC
jgi:hypothetical protein